MEKEEVMKMLFEEHHRHLSETKQKVQGQSQRTIWILALATGWIILSQNPLSESLRYVLVVTLGLIGASTLLALYIYNKNYRTEAKIISKINDFFGFFEKGRFIEDESVYPKSWKCFGITIFLRALTYRVIRTLQGI